MVAQEAKISPEYPHLSVTLCSFTNLQEKKSEEDLKMRLMSLATGSWESEDGAERDRRIYIF